MSLEIDNIPDVSKWQGDIDWTQVPSPIALIKVSDGSNYFDPEATKNYYGAKAAGKAIGMYHFAEWTDPTDEASRFVEAVSPLEENDVLVLDAEAIPAGVDPVAWSLTFQKHVHDTTSVWVMLYINLATLNAYNWSPVLLNSPLWLADWNNNPQGTIPTNHVYVMQQYTDAGSVAGIQGHVDLDAWFDSVAQFQACGYHAPVQPTPPTVEPPAVEPAPVAPPVAPPPIVPPVVPPVELPKDPIAEPVVVITPAKKSWLALLISWLEDFFVRKK